MKPGDRVQVKTAWAAQGPGLPPLMTWMSGYEWVRLVDSDTALVRHLKGGELEPRDRGVRRREAMNAIQLPLFPTRGFGLLGLPGLVEDFETGEPLLVRSRRSKRLISALRELHWGSPRVVRLERHESPNDEIPTFVISEVQR